MGTLNVSDLLKKHVTGATSESTESQLMGTLFIVTNENDIHERGTILLRDFATKESIVCVVDHFLPKLNSSTAYIHIWSFIRDEDLGVNHLEFLLDDIYRSPTPDSLLLTDYLDDDQPAIQASLKHNSFYKPGPCLKLIPKDTTVNIAGTVEAISVLYCKEDTPAAFFVQLCDQDVSVYIMFYGNSFIPFYTSLDIGSIYMFQGLKVTTILNKRGVLSFSELDSRYHPLTLHQYQHELLEIKEPPPPPPPSTVVDQAEDTLTLIPPEQDKTPTTYTGCITRVIDSIFGIYELDHCLILSLFHYLGYSASNPFRVMTRIRLHHIHIATIEPDDGKTTHLFSTLWKAPPIANIDSLRYMAVVACMKSHVEIVSFPPHNEFHESSVSITPHGDLPEEAEIKEHVYMECTSSHATFEQFIRRLEIYAALLVKFMNSPLVLDLNRFKIAYDTILGQVFALTQSHTFKLAGDPVGDFLMHHESCIAVGHTTGVLHVVVDSYPFLDQVKTLMEGQLKEYCLNLAGSSKFFEASHVETQLATYDQTDNYCILGMVDALPDGRLYLMDGYSRILLVVADSQMMDLGGIYLVRRAQMFAEDLSYIREETQDTARAMRQELSSRYIVCQDKDLIPLTMASNKIFQVHTRFLDDQHKELRKYQLSSMENDQVLNQDHQYLAAHVVTVYPTQVCFTAEGKLYLESRVAVQLYNMDGLLITLDYQNFIPTDDLRECILILDSREKSLSWSHLLQVDTRWIIYGLDKQGSKLPEAHRRRLTFLLNTDKHSIYPLLYKHTHNIDAIQLQPVFSSNSTQHTSPNVHNVSDFSNANNNLPASLSEVISNNFFRKLVNVQGVVVTKSFTDGFENVSLVSRRALQLYQDLGISTGKPTRRLFVQLRQPDTLDVLDIFIDLTKVRYPLGLVIGSTVVFRNLIRKLKASSSTREIFCLTEGFTTIQIINTKPSSSVIGMLPSTEQVPTRTISSFMDPVNGGVVLSSDQESPMFKLYCSIQSIIALTLKWECRDCGSIVRNNDCYSMCKNASRAFIANAFVQVSDGSGNANASMDGEPLIFKMLQLSSKQMDALKRVVLKYGQITYGGWGINRTSYAVDDIITDEVMRETEQVQRDAMHGYTLEDLCYNAKKAGQFWLYGKIANTSNKAKRKMLHDDFENDEEEQEVNPVNYDWIQKYGLRKVNISDNGSIFKTLEMAKLKIKVIEVEFAEARSVAYELLKKLEEKLQPVSVEVA
jgi:hypothetical protein